MITVKEEQFAVFRPRARQAVPATVQRGLVRSGVDVRKRDNHLIIRDKCQRESALTFRKDGLPERIERPSGLTCHFDHDSSGRLAAMIYPSGRRLEFGRDKAGEVTSLRQPGFAEYGFRYSKPAGAGGDPLLQAVTYPDHRQRSFEYDSDGRVTAIIEPSGARYVFQRNERGHLTEMRDPMRRVIQMITDEAGAPQSVGFPDGSSESYHFDPAASIAVRTHRDGHETSYLIKDERIAQIGNGPDDSTRFGYDGEGNLTSVERNGQLIAFTVADGEILEEKTSAGSVFYSRDAEGSPLSLGTPFGDSIQYRYDEDGRLVGLTAWGGRELQLSYSSEDTISEILFPNGSRVQQEYGPAMRLTKREVLSSGRVIQRSDYRYDACTRFSGASHRGLFPGESKIAYDADDHVVREESSRWNASYTYDAKGNMTGINGATIKVGPMDEPLEWRGTALAYDKRGNMVTLPGRAGTLQCKYAADGMLSECRTGGGTLRFRYDALGRRVEKTGGTQNWRYGWAGHQLLWEEYREQQDAAPVRRDYLFLPGTVVPLGFREKGRCYWLITDARGAVEMALDDQGEVVWKATYDSFGQVHLEVDKIRQPWRMPGQYEDQETGLYYNFARYYSPQLHSYLSLDPRWIEFDASHYSYCRNDPWNRADPFGGIAPLLAIGIAAVVGAAVGAIVAAATGGDPLAGAVEGAVAGAGALVAVVCGAGAAVILAAGVIASAVGAFAGQMTEQARKGDQFCLMCALKGAGVAALTDLALLGLGKIPGVKKLAGFLGKKLADHAGPITRASRRAWKKAKDAVSQAAGRRVRNGISPRHAESFAEFAAEKNQFVIVRNSNDASMKYQGQPGYTAKPMSCKAKTAKHGEDAGLVVDPTHPKQQKAWDDAELAAKDDPEKLAQVKSDRENAEKYWKKYEEDTQKSTGKKPEVDDQGRALQDGKKIHGDYDLHGVYDGNSKERVSYGSGDANSPDESLARQRRKEMNEHLDPDGKSEMVQHGGQDDWNNPNKSPDPPVTVFKPDGTSEQLKDADEMKDFYESNGLPWTYGG
ncbi:RHS repeat-associated core domain-containing protein [Prosthecobacter sp. SYSU 5D2]|uniref:RHS repeat domain-containing protein n=1 Tax=Prosthecobacter sp. SYSU 5D2 TaxID=3134134 RepID=UPI0031FEC49B